MNSCFFIEKFESGELRDESDFFDWYMAKRELEIWNKKLEITFRS